MAEKRRRYRPDFKEQLVELVRSGRSVGSVAREFGASEQAIRNWVKQADVDEGHRSDGLTAEARKELRRLKRENERLRMERDILKNSHGHPGAGHPAALKLCCGRGQRSSRLTGARSPLKNVTKALRGTPQC